MNTLNPFDTSCLKCGDFDDLCDCPLAAESLFSNMQKMTFCEFIKYSEHINGIQENYPAADQPDSCCKEQVEAERR